MAEWRRRSSGAIPGAPPTPEELGNAGWTVLHTAAAVYPNKPSVDQQEAFRSFVMAWSKVYACSHCAYHMRTVLARKPPVVSDKRSTSKYVCELHNEVNHMLGKEEYDCDPDLVLKRWHPTYPDMEDTPIIEEQLASVARPQQSPSPQGRTASVDGGEKHSSRWWGRSAGSPQDGQRNGAPQGAASQGVADGETDVDAVLRRLKGCQVYCPEKKDK